MRAAVAGLIRTAHVATHAQLADILTKVLPAYVLSAHASFGDTENEKTTTYEEKKHAASFRADKKQSIVLRKDVSANVNAVLEESC
ncbi:hypothetical protein CJ030_MR1G016608 [Morella rubra]|uniref:Uncharacterized protein n=1 Tax=Morella rubra TaxID=262757 RepID=A0A6A1WN68_9ROSI|nr:hypothetical protein CJ030_MR1G016608 [Morella rubra]